MGRKLMHILIVIMIFTTCITMVGCNGKSIYGTWQLTEMQVGENTYTIEEFAEQVNSSKANKVTIVLEISEDEFTLKNGENLVAEGVCEDTEDGYALIINGSTVIAQKSGSELVLHDTSSDVKSKMVFVKK